MKINIMKLSNITIFDINKKFIEEAKRLQKYGVNVIHSDVKDLIDSENINCVVSPAKSFGFMDGGINKIYSNIFHNNQKKVMNKINYFGLQTNFGRAYLPIGSSIAVDTCDNKYRYLLSVSSMFFSM